MGRLLLIRHGESEGNRDRVFCRTPDVPLTEEGRCQARAAGEWIAERYAPVRIVTSPFARAAVLARPDGRASSSLNQARPSVKCPRRCQNRHNAPPILRPTSA